MPDIRPPSWLELESVIPLELPAELYFRRDGHAP